MLCTLSVGTALATTLTEHTTLVAMRSLESARSWQPRGSGQGINPTLTLTLHCFEICTSEYSLDMETSSAINLGAYFQHSTLA